MDDCLFCKIYRGEIPSEILHKDDHCFAIKDINPVSPVHLLIIPSVHLTYLQSFEVEDFRILNSMYKVAAELAVREGISESGYRLVINQKRDSGQQVPHLHLHLIGGHNLAGIG
ncbi:MAG: histidine triad nucleotide-binding protein [Chloroflexota bacterium]|jgi:histidine triad (HIT) family protein|uniref:HIT domain-containing protein n=1 Tax=marine metagenome TaxID=408172 RepID=A0A381TA56_9ZZZZ|nr:histidine triad nucleotide-binding protein [Chloroflexota bacterium]MBH35505.1 histidine triad nucleotide-binding protein [Dehalococcoidia bacterium]MEC7913609.1 histidine triad nucleotide-binding protein [Chloroflexota bacterium]|tara:strand:- start:5 stop:346 length:342 start_codon:yes stop_codon:yes gene_type:complete